MPLPYYDLSTSPKVLCFAHLQFVDRDELVHEQLVDNTAGKGCLEFNLGELRPLDGAVYGIVEIYGHAFDEKGGEVEIGSVECVALALLITLARVDVHTMSERSSSLPTS